ncbi:BRCT domain-containing protein [Wolbachia endosymbiont (group A) of Lasioglossum morio]|uniref:BRCT domain-containing protein n=1 Tax=Wolbachia endosymbiont (group A) of Lasioglossum morio TaxID=2954025 RepID=UPI0022277BE7|nr:BRCT domain-containing protein [Wolbachia endosymbiont (group A) of Lasioglossum morio]
MEVLDIKGFGSNQVEFLYDLGLIRKISDIFALEEKLKNFNLSEQRGGIIFNLLHSINSKRTVTLEKFITSLGIRLVGPRAAKIQANHYKSYDGWYEVMAQLPYDREAPDKLMIIGVGEETITSLEEFFSDEDNAEMVKNLASQLKIEPVSANVSNSPFSGKIVVFTGKLSKMERNEAQALMESLGGIVSSSVSNKTNFVVVGEKPGSKLEKAKKLGVKILTEEKFVALLQKR